MSNTSIKIKVDKVTPRISYVCDFVFSERGFNYQLVTESKDFDVNYTEPVASSLLYSNDILQEEPSFNEEQGVFEFNEVVDYFAAIFFVLTRMEEYVAIDKDKHGRFTARQSVLTKLGLLDKVICDRWAVQILEAIEGVEIPNPTLSLEPTFDIDNTYAYRFKKGIRRKLSIIRDRIRNDKARLKERQIVDAGGEDPYDTFDKIEEIVQRFPQTKLFWLVKSHGKFDRNLDVNHPKHRALIKRMHSSARVGIHPSYDSFCKVKAVQTERSLLGEILDEEVMNSRQHYLRFTLPDSYETLLNAGIRNDFTMGFAEKVGFRAGTARSFPWFDLANNRATSLMVHPFAYMDGTLNEYMNLSPEEAKAVVSALFEEVKEYGGTFRFIWHNETIGDYNNWKGWYSVLEHTLSLHHE